MMTLQKGCALVALASEYKSFCRPYIDVAFERERGLDLQIKVKSAKDNHKKIWN